MYYIDPREQHTSEAGNAAAVRHAVLRSFNCRQEDVFRSSSRRLLGSDIYIRMYVTDVRAAIAVRHVAFVLLRRLRGRGCPP